jgi:hypothetical protein
MCSEFNPPSVFQAMVEDGCAPISTPALKWEQEVLPFARCSKRSHEANISVSIAEAQIDLRRIRGARHRFLSDLLSKPDEPRLRKNLSSFDRYEGRAYHAVSSLFVRWMPRARRQILSRNRRPPQCYCTGLKTRPDFTISDILVNSGRTKPKSSIFSMAGCVQFRERPQHARNIMADQDQWAGTASASSRPDAAPSRLHRPPRESLSASLL